MLNKKFGKFVLHFEKKTTQKIKLISVKNDKISTTTASFLKKLRFHPLQNRINRASDKFKILNYHQNIFTV